MAILHRATITPTKLELVEAWLDQQPWGGSGDLEQVGAYRFDDPAGEVGVEALLVARGDVTLHVPMTYRGAPLEDADAHLMGRMQHSVLGERWVHEAQGDPVGVACFVAALSGHLEQAGLDVWDGDRLVERREPSARISVVLDEPAGAVPDVDPDPALDLDGRVVSASVGDATLYVARVIERDGETGVAGMRQLEVAWSGGRAVVAALQ
jgi:hypothetical protein